MARNGRFVRSILILIAVGLALAPLATAGSQPALYFLKDGPTPLDDGAMDADMPEGNESSIRPIPPAIDGADLVFLGGDLGGERLRGPLFVGLWTDGSAVLDGQINATVYLVQDGALEAVAGMSIDISTDPESLPDPTSLVPPDPTDPEAAALYIAAQAAPLVLKPPMLFNLGSVDIEVPEGAGLALGLSLESTSGLPIGIGVATVKYDALLTPSFVYAPWWSADPAPSGSSSASSSASGSASASPSSSSSSSAMSDAPAGSSDGKDSPGLGWVATIGAVGLVALLRRR